MSRALFPQAVDVPPRVAGIVLASGLSRRLSGANKLLLPVAGTAVVRRTVAAYLDAGLAGVHVVVGYEADRVRAALSGLSIEFVDNPAYEVGQSRALVAGVAALPESVDAAVIGVGDQPLLTSGIVRALVGRWRESGAAIVAPRYGGRRGNPVLFVRPLFGELMAVQGDVGGRSVVEAHARATEWVDVADESARADIDTPEDYQSLLASMDG